MFTQGGGGQTPVKSEERSSSHSVCKGYLRHHRTDQAVKDHSGVFQLSASLSPAQVSQQPLDGLTLLRGSTFSAAAETESPET